MKFILQMKELNDDPIEAEDRRVRSEFRDYDRKKDILEKLRVTNSFNYTLITYFFCPHN